MYLEVGQKKTLTPPTHIRSTSQTFYLGLYSKLQEEKNYYLHINSILYEADS